MPSHTESIPLGAGLGRAIPVLVVFLAWELVSRIEVVNPNVFPPVSEIVLRWFVMLGDARTYTSLGATLWRALAGLAAALIIGIPLGLAMGRVRAVEWFFEPLFSFGFPLPKIALVPLYVHLFGLFSLSKVLLIFTDCLFPIVIFSYHGARGISPIYLWSAQARGTGPVRMLWRVVLPLSLASIYDGVQVAVVVAVLVAVVTEMVSGGGGLGHQMISAFRYGDVRTAFATLVTISLVGYVFYRFAQWGRDRLLGWHVSES